MNKKFKVLVSAPYVQKEIDRFHRVFEKFNLDCDIPYVEERMVEDDLLRVIHKYDGVICGDDAFTEAVIKQAKKLKVISKWGTGIDSIDLKSAEKNSIKVCNTPNAFSHPVADTVLGFMLCFSRNINISDNLMKEGKWIKIRSKALSEQVLGIIGLGNVGEQVARRAKAFGMKIIANDIRLISNAVCEEFDIKLVSKDELYSCSDYISINCTLNETTKYLLTMDEFNRMSKNPYIINTARGPIIKERDLIGAIENKQIKGAGLDVFEVEPLAQNSPLRKMENVILSSHNSNSSPQYWDLVHINTINNLLNVLHGTNKKWIERL